MRGTVKQVLGALGALAALTIIVEHAGGFSKVLESGSKAAATGYQTIVRA